MAGVVPSGVGRIIAEHEFGWLLHQWRDAVSEDEYDGVGGRLTDVLDALTDQVFGGGFHGPPLHELAYRVQGRLYSDRPHVDALAKRTLALQRDITELVHAQVVYRRAHGGNVVWEWCGPTGLTKSSCMLGVMERHNGLAEHVVEGGVAALQARVTIDPVELPELLEGLGVGDAVALDEQTKQVGEGARTAADLVANIEDTLRGAMVDMHFASPERREGHPSQGVFEALAVNTEAHATRFLVWYTLAGEAVPLGVAEMPWCSPSTWAAYSEFKARNLERTKAGAFGAGLDLEYVLGRLMRQPSVRAQIGFFGRVSQADWKRLVVEYGPSMSNAQAATVASKLERMGRMLRENPGVVAEAFGFEPSPEVVALLRGAADDELKAKRIT